MRLLNKTVILLLSACIFPQLSSAAVTITNTSATKAIYVKCGGDYKGTIGAGEGYNYCGDASTKINCDEDGSYLEVNGSGSYYCDVTTPQSGTGK